MHLEDVRENDFSDKWAVPLVWLIVRNWSNVKIVSLMVEQERKKTWKAIARSLMGVT